MVARAGVTDGRRGGNDVVDSVERAAQRITKRRDPLYKLLQRVK